MSRQTFHVRSGDTVQVISGNHKGAQGRILQVIGKKQQVIIEGVRMLKKHARRTQQNQSGGIISQEGPVHVSNVKLVERPTAPVRFSKRKA